MFMENKNTKVSKFALIGSLLFSFYTNAQEVPATSQNPEPSQVEISEPVETPQESDTEAAQEPESTIETVEPYQMFVTEELYIFVHSGSTNEFRIIGRIGASDPVEVIAKDTQSGWLQVNYGNNRSGWVDSTSLVNSAGTKVQLSQAQKTVTELRQQIESLKELPGKSVAELNQQLAELQEQNQQLNLVIEQLNQDKATIEASIVQRNEMEKILDKLYDVGVILIGVFVGWLLTRRRKSGLSFNHL